MASAQVGKSEALLNIIGFHTDYDPCPILMLQPTVEMAQAFSKDRVTAGLYNSTPCLKGKIGDPRSRDSNNTTLHKVFTGGALTMVGANSPAGLASRPIRLVLCDEVDRYPRSAGEEGDPIQLARKRTATFWNKKIVKVSTPTNKGDSRIEDDFEMSDKRYYHVPCKHCGHEQRLMWAGVKWEDGDPETAAYMCEECATLWSEPDRLWSIQHGKWVATEPFNGTAGFHISAIYSPWTTLSEGVSDFLTVKKNPEQLRVWTNTYLGETWEDKGESLDDEQLAERREDMTHIPDEVVLITAGVDVQDNRLEMSTIGWGRDDESWVIDHKTFYGDPSTPQLWGALDSELMKEYETVSGRKMTLKAAAVDSGGHFTNSVYAFCKKNWGRRIFAVKGRGGEGTAVVSKPSKNNIMKCPLFMVGVHTVKDVLFARMKINEEGPGYIHFNDTLDDEYFRQLTAETIITSYSKGFQKRIYKKTRARNEALDCMVYATAAYAIINPNVNALADKLESSESEKDAESAQKPAKSGKKPFVQKQKGSFVNGWR